MSLDSLGYYNSNMFLQNFRNTPTFGNNSYIYNNPNIGNMLAGQPAQDSFVNSKKNDTGKTAAIIGTGAVVIGITALAFKGKFKEARKLAENIDFKPAKTISEAAEFSKTHLGIRANNIDDLQTANWVNEGLVNLNNLTKGKTKMPWGLGNMDVGDYCKNGHALMTTTKDGNSILNINKNFIDNIDTYMENGAKMLGQKNMLPKELAEQLGRKNTFDLKQKIELCEDLEILGSDLRVGANHYAKGVRGDVFKNISHEMAHLQHELNVGTAKFDLMKKPQEFIANNKPVSDVTKDFMAKHSKTVSKEVGWYAGTSPNEFVAETYAQLAGGRKFSDEIMSLYKQYGGAPL